MKQSALGFALLAILASSAAPATAQADDGEAEGTGAEFVSGFASGLGIAYLIDEHWLIEVEVTYAWIPTSDIVEHEFAQLAGFGYAF